MFEVVAIGYISSNTKANTWRSVFFQAMFKVIISLNPHPVLLILSIISSEYIVIGH